MKPLDPFEITFSGVNLVEASAGTGKTYNIASFYIRAIIEEGRRVNQILVVTYTEAATKELRDRLMKRLRESVRALEGVEFANDEFLQRLPRQVDNKTEAIQKLKLAIRSFDEAAVFTIHGFCRQILLNQAFESKVLFDAELINDDSEITGELIDDFWRSWVHQASQNEAEKPLLKAMLAKGYTPKKLRDELARYIGKTYLKLRPEESGSPKEFIKQIDELSALYNEMKKSWEGAAGPIHQLLQSESLNGNKYRKSSLPGWIEQMNNWLQDEIVPIEAFGAFDKLTQSTINASLKKNRTQPPEHPFFTLADRYQVLAAPLRQFDVYFKLQLFIHLRQKIESKKEELQVFAFDDLLIKLRNALRDEEYGPEFRQTLRNMYPVAMVDEFQDTDPIQYQIFQMIYGSGEIRKDETLFMIGDPKQSIYSFRGADIFTYLEAKNDAPKNKMFSLDRNFRSVPPLIDGINALFSFRENPFILKEIAFHKAQAGKKAYERLTVDGESTAPIIIRKLTLPTDKLPLNKGVAEERSAHDTAAQIYRLLQASLTGNAKIGEEPVEAGDIAVLVRSHYQADIISGALKERGIKSVQYSRESVFKTDEAEELQYVLKAVAESANEGLVKAALATDFMKYSADDLIRFEEDEQRWIEKLAQFATWQNDWQQHGLAYMFRQLMNEEHTAEKIIRYTNGERKLTNFIHLAELLQQQERQGKTGARSLLHWLAKKRNEDQKKADEEQIRLESDENLVKVVTMHRSKGLEYSIVFCPFLWKGPQFSDEGNPIVYHSSETDSSVYIDFNGKDDPDRNKKRFQAAVEDVAESVRLAYVAMTRAKYQCVISWAHAAKTEFSPLGYLLLGREQSFDALNKTISTDKKYKAVDPSKFEESFNEIFRKNTSFFLIEDARSSGQQELGINGQQPALEARKFERKAPLNAGFGISSFSSLVRNEQSHFEEDYLSYFDEPSQSNSPVDKRWKKTFFDFPKGPNPGTAVHHIFEEIDFSDSKEWKSIIAESLAMQSIDEDWAPVVEDKLHIIVDKNLRAREPQLQLSGISPAKRIPELEFYFRSGNVHLQQLLQIIRPAVSAPQPTAGFSDEGYLKGFIDLTFIHKQRYYILDYKTNYLGDTVADYREELLEDEMKDAFYDLQYHIYSVALHRFLRSRLPNYSYETHFGGVFYLFLRGINKNDDEGIYFDCPVKSVINKLDDYLGRGNE